MMRLYCFGESGNAYKAALMLTLCGLPWTPVFVDFFNGETRSDAYRANINAMGEVPVLKDDGKSLSQSAVILDHLARRTGRFAPTEAEREECWRWILFDNHKFTANLATFRFLRVFAKGTDPAVMAFMEARTRAAYRVADSHFATNAFVIGSRPTIADISMAGYVFFPKEETGLDLSADYPAVARWRDRIAALPDWRGPYDLMPRAFRPEA